MIITNKPEVEDFIRRICKGELAIELQQKKKGSHGLNEVTKSRKSEGAKMKQRQ
jgi:hypothetical protein